MSYRWKRFQKPRYRKALLVVDHAANGPLLSNLALSSNFAQEVDVYESKEAILDLKASGSEAILYAHRDLTKQVEAKERMPEYILNGEDFPEKV